MRNLSLHCIPTAAHHAKLRLKCIIVCRFAQRSAAYEAAHRVPVPPVRGAQLTLTVVAGLFATQCSFHLESWSACACKSTPHAEIPSPVPRLARAPKTGKLAQQCMLTNVQLACDPCKAIVYPCAQEGAAVRLTQARPGDKDYRWAMTAKDSRM